jgi:ferredoxin
VDRTICSGQARCESIAPEVFVLNDEGYNDTDDQQVSEAHLTAACRGALACPERAIILIDDNGHEMSDTALRRLAGLDT